jgi:hypothetical protein
MRLSIDIKPTKLVITSYSNSKVVASTKNEIVSKIKNNYKGLTSTFSSVSSGALIDRQGEYIIAYNLQKLRRKTTRRKSKRGVITEVVRPGHWVAYVYRIPVSFLKVSNRKVDQRERNFALIKSK